MRALALITFGAIVLGRDLIAQASGRVPVRCDRVATTSFEFGRTGGNIRSASVRVGANGIVSRQAGDTWAPQETIVPRDTMTRLARLAWAKAFTRLPVAPSRPTRNPDAARDFIDVHSACGSKHVEFAIGEAKAPFRDLLAMLTRAAHQP